MYNTPTYTSWRGMKERVTNVNHKDYNHYGGRSITVCARWLGKEGFSNFFADMGIRPEGMSIDRSDVNGNYEPSNCKWATIFEQVSNARSNIVVHFNGEDMTASAFARLHGITPSALYARMKQHNLPPEKAVSVELLRTKYNGFTIQQIADVVGCGRSTVYLHIAKGKRSPKFGPAINEVVAASKST